MVVGRQAREVGARLEHERAPGFRKTEAKLSGLSAMHSGGKLTSLTPSKIISSMVVPEPARATLVEP